MRGERPGAQRNGASERRLELSLQGTLPERTYKTMSKLNIDASSLLISLLAAAFGFSLLPGPFAWMASIGGLILAIVLLAYDREDYRSVAESLAYGAVVALCLTLASGVLMKIISSNQGQGTSFEGRLGGEWMPFLWLGTTILLWVIDRSRMSGRVQYGTALPAGGTPFSFAAPPPAPAPAAPVQAPAAASIATTLPIHEQPRATFTRPSFGGPAAETPTRVEAPAPAPVFDTSTPSGLEPAAVVPAFSQPQPPAPAALPATPPPPAPTLAPVPHGKEAMIYVTLVGEGMNVLRAVRAEALGRDYYRIVDEMPEGEVWQFGPGQVVRCKKKNLSSGKAMVAMEEAQRAS